MDREGCSAYVIVAGLFRIAIDARLRRRGMAQICAVETIIDSLLKNRGQYSVQGTIITADRE